MRPPKRPLRLRLFSGLLHPEKPIGNADEKEKEYIMRTFDLIMESDSATYDLGRILCGAERYDTMQETKQKRKRLKIMIKRRAWDSYNECARKFSKKKGIDIVEAMFERLATIALGEAEDENNSAKYAVLLLNTIFDEEKELAAHPGFKPKLSTIDEINEASVLVMDMLLEGSISMEVAERFHRLLTARVALLESSTQSVQLDHITQFISRVQSGDVVIATEETVNKNNKTKL